MRAPHEGKQCREHWVFCSLSSSFWCLCPDFAVAEFPFPLWVQSREAVHQGPRSL